MKQTTLRWSGAALLTVSAAAFGASIWTMSNRLEALRAAEPLAQNYFIPLGGADFEYLGRSVEIETDVNATPPVIVVQYGEAVETLPVVGRDIPELGELDRHTDWMRVLLLAGEAGDQADQFELLREQAPGSRLVVVARGGAPGFDPETWGSAHYKDWVYVLLVLEPDGAITRLERTYRELARTPYSWEFTCAMTVTPSLHTPAMRSSSPIAYPNYGPVQEAINSMGWSWPVAGVSMLTGVVGALMFAASYVSRKPDDFS